MGCCVVGWSAGWALTHVRCREPSFIHSLIQAAVEHASLTSGKITDLEKGMETILQRCVSRLTWLIDP